jgi:hypothetical protein
MSTAAVSATAVSATAVLRAGWCGEPRQHQNRHGWRRELEESPP